MMESPAVALPSWLEACRIPDHVLAQAYDSTPHQWRVAVKTAIAATHFHFGDPLLLSSRTRSSRLLTLRERRWPVDMALVLAPAAMGSAALATYAALLPTLAGVKQTVWICLGRDASQSQLVSLELCGVEDIYVISHAQMLDLMGVVPISAPMLLLGSVPSAHTITAHTKNRFAHICDRPVAWLASPKAFDPELLRFALGFKPTTTSPAPRTAWKVIYATREFRKSNEDSYGGALWIEPGFECFWLSPDLRPDFFTHRSFSVAHTSDHSPE